MRQPKKDASNPVAIITGSDRGIGFETCRQLAAMDYQIVLTSPDKTKGRKAIEKLQKQGANVVFHVLDLLRPKDIRDLKKFVMAKFSRVDVLVNNAGVLLDEGRSKLDGILVRRLKKIPKKVEPGQGPGILNIDLDIVRVTFEINTLGPLQMCQAFIPIMKDAGYGRVVNVSSSRGQLNGMTDDGAPAYQLSKAALNAVTLMFADAVRGTNVIVNSVHPGWTRTDIGGRHAPNSVEQAAQTIVWLATHPDNELTGGFYMDKELMDW